MTTRTASCRCGQLKATVTGEPVRVSVCHCRNCQKRSGSAFAAQARWPKTQFTIHGKSNTFTLASDAGNPATFHFCPKCGSDVYYVIDGKFEDLVAIPLGAFGGETSFGDPEYSVWEVRKYPWVAIVGDDIEHFD